MNRVTFSGLLVVVCLFFALPRSLPACPSCSEAAPLSDGEESDEQRLGRAYNHSIYLMVGMPYLLLGTVGWLVYRGLRQRAGLAPLAEHSSPATGPGPANATGGSQPCSPPSPGAVS
jgi:hypothetical protein